jgi:2-amino-4-hydroxy-6-hydroxymethyldihydropteridine diphosphokinase
VRDTPVAIALGANLGDRQAHLQFAIERLSSLLTDLRVSAVHDTEPVGVVEPQPRYLNAAAVGVTTLEPLPLLEALLAIEAARGRERRSLNAARTLDLDLILFGDRVVRVPGLVVPHPRFRERRFVLEPLAELAPEWVDPATGKTLAELLAALAR